MNKITSRRVARAVTSLALAATAVVGVAAPADAFVGPRGLTQFVRISAVPLTAWSATMVLYDIDAKPVYTWKIIDKSGSGTTWWYRANPGDVLVLKIFGAFYSDVYNLTSTPAANCVKVTTSASVLTSDGCTPD